MGCLHRGIAFGFRARCSGRNLLSWLLVCLLTQFLCPVQPTFLSGGGREVARLRLVNRGYFNWKRRLLAGARTLADLTSCHGARTFFVPVDPNRFFLPLTPVGRIDARIPTSLMCSIFRLYIHIFTMLLLQTN